MNIFTPYIYDLSWDSLSSKPSHLVFLVLNPDFDVYFNYPRPASIKSHWCLLRETKLYFVDDLGGKFRKSDGIAIHSCVTSSWYLIDFSSIVSINYSNRLHRKYLHQKLKAQNES